MRKIILTVLALFTAATALSSCSNKHWIKYYDGLSRTDEVKVQVFDGYEIDNGHAYDIICDDNRYDIVFHLVKSGVE